MLCLQAVKGCQAHTAVQPCVWRCYSMVCVLGVTKQVAQGLLWQRVVFLTMQPAPGPMRCPGNLLWVSKNGKCKACCVACRAAGHAAAAQETLEGLTDQTVQGLEERIKRAEAAVADAEQAAQEAFGYQDQAAEHADVSKAHVDIAESQSSAAEKVGVAPALPVHAGKAFLGMAESHSSALKSSSVHAVLMCVNDNFVQHCSKGEQ